MQSWCVLILCLNLLFVELNINLDLLALTKIIEPTWASEIIC